MLKIMAETISQEYYLTIGGVKCAQAVKTTDTASITRKHAMTETVRLADVV